MLGDGYQVEYGSSRFQGMTLDDLERFVQGAKMAGANGDEIVKVEASFKRTVRRMSVQFTKIPSVYEDAASKLTTRIPAQPNYGEGDVNS